MRVDQLMSRDVKTCAVGATLGDAARIMWEHDCGCVPIVSGNGTLVGMLTDRDICMAAFLNDRPIRGLPVRETMSRQVITCYPHDQVADVEEKMRTAQLRRLPVVNGVGHVVGIVSLNDLAVEATHQHAKRTPEVTLAEVGRTLGEVCMPRTAISAALG